MIANAGCDERGKIHGGQAGDQTGGEYRVRTWYDRPWDAVLRPKRKDVAEIIAEVSENAASNPFVGYDQYQRLTYHNENVKVGYHPEKIKTPCETDCSASSTEAAISAGHRLNIESLKNLPTNTYSGNIVSRFKKTGEFEVLRDSKYLTSDKYLRRGDILVYEGHHVAVNLTNGSLISKSQTYTGTFPVLPKRGYYEVGNKGTNVKRIQLFMNWALDARLDVDGIFGVKTEAAVKKFQRKVKIDVDGVFGKQTLAAAKKFKIEVK